MTDKPEDDKKDGVGLDSVAVLAEPIVVPVPVLEPVSESKPESEPRAESEPKADSELKPVLASVPVPTASELQKSAPFRAIFQSGPIAVRRLVHERCEVILFKFQDTLAPPLTVGVAIDISATGVGLVLRDPVSPGTRVVIEIRSHKQVHRFEAQVAWCRDYPMSGRVLTNTPLTYAAGLMFGEGGMNDSQVLKEFTSTL